MSQLKTRLAETMKNSLKSGDKSALAFARNLHALVRKKEIDDRVDLNDDGIQKIIVSSLKQRQESVDQYRAGNRADLVEKEESEIKFLKSFLPEPMSNEEVQALVKKAIQESGATSAKEMGKVMALVLPQVQGRADGKWVSQLVKEGLAALG